MAGTKPSGRHQEKRLTTQSVRAIKEPGFYGDGNGLYLKVDSNGAKRWVQRIVIQGKRRDIGLGSVSLNSLAEAREAALQQRKQARAGEDPIALKKRLQGVPSFEEAAKKYHAISSPNWRNGKHVQQWINTLTEHAFPKIGNKSISAINGTDVLDVLTPIWNNNPETAKRVKQRIGVVMQWAIGNEWRTDNPAEAISKILPKHDRSRVRHRLALPYDQVGRAISKVQASGANTVSKLAFEFLVLTATRSGETLKARWSEVELDKSLWTIPVDRMKAKKAHRVPLCERAVAILKCAQQFKSEDSDLVFPGTVRGKPLSDMTLSKLMKELKIEAVPHGFRSSFRDWAAEQTSHAHSVMEAALAHVIKDKAEAAYARSDLFDKRRSLMKEWSDYLIQE